MKKRYSWDFILIAILLSVSLLTVGILFFVRKAGAYAVVEINGAEALRLSLSENGEYEIGDGSNVLIINDGWAYMKYADCPDKVCVNTGKIRYGGQRIVCLPNKVEVYIRGDGVDIVS